MKYKITIYLLVIVGLSLIYYFLYSAHIVNVKNVEINEIAINDKQITIEGKILVPESSSFYKRYSKREKNGTLYLKVYYGRVTPFLNNKTSSFKINIDTSSHINKIILLDEANEITIWEE